MAVLANLEVTWLCLSETMGWRRRSELGVRFDCVDGFRADVDRLVEHSGVTCVNFGFTADSLGVE